ncbi:MAG TPA: hypothetical protein P5077_02290 [bacterium]|nr:hypothetical protein [bacterium]
MKRICWGLCLILLATTPLAADGPEQPQGPEKDQPAAEEKGDEPVADGGRVYLKVGGGLLFDERRIAVEPAFGFGYRYTQGSFAVDLSVFNETIGPTVDYAGYKEEQEYERNALRITMSRWIGISFLWVAEPRAWNSFFTGGGLAIETLDLELASESSSQTGLGVTFVAGWEFLRDRTVMLFAQAEVDLPCYTARFYGDRFWVPSIVFVIGAGL